jgi:hypothetical protein
MDLLPFYTIKDDITWYNEVYLRVLSYDIKLCYLPSVVYLYLENNNGISFNNMSQYTLYLSTYAVVQEGITNFPKYLIYLYLHDFRTKISKLSDYLIYLISGYIYIAKIDEFPKSLLYLYTDITNGNNSHIPQYMIKLELYETFPKMPLPLYIKYKFFGTQLINLFD